MKKLFLALTVIIAVIFVSLNFSCTQQKAGETEEVAATENTLKSVSLLEDTINVQPAILLASLERINQVIDSIGYPDAGYQLWIVQSDTAADYRYMINGFWPDQEIYDEIHDHELYKRAWEEEEDLWNMINISWYNRFEKVK